jgi:hypothetical protein
MADLFALLTARARGEAPLLRLRPRGLFEQGGGLPDAPMPVAAPHATATPGPLPMMTRGTAPPVLHRRAAPSPPAAIAPVPEAAVLAVPVTPRSPAASPPPNAAPGAVLAQAATLPETALPETARPGAAAPAGPIPVATLPRAASPAATVAPGFAEPLARALPAAQAPRPTTAPASPPLTAPAPAPADAPHAAQPMSARRAGVSPPDARPSMTPDLKIEIGRIELRAAPPPPAPAPPRPSLLMPLDRYLKRGPRA